MIGDEDGDNDSEADDATVNDVSCSTTGSRTSLPPQPDATTANSADDAAAVAATAAENAVCALPI